MRHGNLLYPAVGIGNFFAMFCLGITLTYDLGLPGLIVAGIDLVAGWAGASPIVRLQQSDPDF